VNPWPRPLQKPHPPIWIPGGGSSRPGAGARRGLRLLVPLLLRLQGRRVDDEGFWDEMDVSARTESLSRGLSAVRRRRRDQRRGASSSTASRRSTSTAAACTSIRASRSRRAT
jgi:hypothetical protein